MAVSRKAVIISKGGDFLERSLLLGQPPQVVLIASGNCSNDELIQLLGAAMPALQTELTRGARFVVVHPSRPDVYD